MNCIGTLLSYHIRDWRRIPGGFVDYERLSPELFRSVQLETTFHDVIQEEIASPAEYEVALRIPFALFQETTNGSPESAATPTVRIYSTSRGKKWC